MSAEKPILTEKTVGHTPGPWRVQPVAATWIETVGDPYGHGVMHIADPNEHAKLSARSAVKHALACGQIVKQPCFCGNTRVDAHHDDYSRPLQVVWLCRTHHVVLHHAKAEGVK